MKYMTLVLAVTVLFSASSYAAKQITRQESAGYTKIGELSFKQSGIPTVGHKELSKKVNQKCEEMGNVKADNCYYFILDKTGNESNHENVDVEIFKK
ncbi:hypothetical protein PL78_17990 [Yersinia entomophaga]|uniref:Uncharacterized protein n=1 Tax=Yersinia entomophaga TaxID=935293 RepID=A0ABN4PXG8_YERET|nr:hypothetical protein [Yersinia entomophaga]ANI31698.1 hypothetical protein PL78_17990 [Yersinia entomophaga]OWF85012.1 hypothetical protein B4914_18260 [Yersinia entomophaga]